MITSINEFKKLNENNKKFTFKTENPVGRQKSFDKPTYYIKLDKKQVGIIYEKESKQIIRLQVTKTEIITDNNPNCPQKQITLKAQHNSLDEAKVFLNTHINTILNQQTLYPLD